MVENKQANKGKGVKRPPVTSLRLDAELKRLAWQAAKAEGRTLTEWLNDVMRRQLRLEGRRLQQIQRDQWKQLGLPAKDKDKDDEA